MTRTLVVIVSVVLAAGTPRGGPDSFAAQSAGSPERRVGWRNDGSGRYPQATPPLEWSETRNILWKTRIGPNKYSSPVIVDRKIFLVA
ncbi:MAG TPA: hypothetical protein VKU80_17000, partial [Planctomycetota bacterium]|nr:hypothetical protein [Planctomycetota bacterium]